MEAHPGLEGFMGGFNEAGPPLLPALAGESAAWVSTRLDLSAWLSWGHSWCSLSFPSSYRDQWWCHLSRSWRWPFLLLFLMSLPRGLSILRILENQFWFYWFSLVTFLFSTSLISVLIFIVSFLWLALGWSGPFSSFISRKLTHLYKTFLVFRYKYLVLS